MINPLAQELNDILAETSIGKMFSDLGKRMYFPKGIIAQSGEAKTYGKVANGTIGTTVINGKTAILPSIQKQLPSLTSAEAVGYAPTAGVPELQSLWKEKIIKKNPSLTGKLFSTPVVIPGLTAGISYLCDLFINEGETLLAADPSWDNYALIVEARKNGVFKQFKMFKNGGFDMDSFKNALLEEAKTGKIRVILNFPQNPSGYSITKTEADQICTILKDIAETGCTIMVWCDDAYFGLAYEENIEKESLFAHCIDLHENVIAVKIDGPTKEDYVWGFRTGFLTFGAKGLTQEHYDALYKKLMGVVRSSVSCASSPSQNLLIHALKDQDLPKEKEAMRNLLESRYKKVRNFVDSKKDHAVLQPLPFNSGYFMSLECIGISAEALRVKLLHEKGIGTIAIDDNHLRIAFSSIDEDMIDTVYEAVYGAAEELAQN